MRSNTTRPSPGATTARGPSRRTVLAGAIMVGSTAASNAAPLPPGVNLGGAAVRDTDPRILAAYNRFLEDERRFLAYRMEMAGLWPHWGIPCRTGLDQFHDGFLMPEWGSSEAGPNEAPEDRAERMLRAAGVDIAATLKRSNWVKWGQT